MGQLLRVESEEERQALARLLAARILAHRGERMSAAAIERETSAISRWICVTADRETARPAPGRSASDAGRRAVGQ